MLSLTCHFELYVLFLVDFLIPLYEFENMLYMGMESYLDRNTGIGQSGVEVADDKTVQPPLTNYNPCIVENLHTSETLLCYKTKKVDKTLTRKRFLAC